MSTYAWREANLQHLVAGIVWVRQAIAQHKQGQPIVQEWSDPLINTADSSDELSDSTSSLALDQLCTLFNLSAFERTIILVGVGIELDNDFAILCAETHGDLQRNYPTLNLMLKAFPNANWSAFTPKAPLRYWRLIEVEAGRTLAHSPFRIDERILHYLLGEQYLDDRFQGIIQSVTSTPDLVPSHQGLAEQIVELWNQDGKSRPVIQLYGSEAAGKQAIASTVTTLTQRHLYNLTATAIPTNPNDLHTLSLLWERETALSNGVLLVDCESIDLSDRLKSTAIAQLIGSIQSPVIVSSRDRDRSLFEKVETQQRPVVSLEVDAPTTSEQRLLWQTALGSAQADLNGQVEDLVVQFNLNAPTINAICAQGVGVYRAHLPDHPQILSSQIPSSQIPNSQTPTDLKTSLWDLCRTQSRPQMDDLAQRIESTAGWDDLVLPEPQAQILRAIAAHVHCRTQVYETWGFSAKGKRGLGISALFAGASGTGKTMAAEVLAQVLRLDLYRIDLSAMVSKYIGETEKNLRRVFDAAESGSVILLFDEADALFGKRSEVKDSHDRYANMEVSYLLQRMEAYRGLSVLTTNMKEAIDTAFLRRIRFVVKFPFPDANQREEIWRRVFPKDTPTEGLDIPRLARLNVAGGNIRNIALNAAFLAAAAQEKVGMKHLREAAQSEYAKLEQTLTDAEVRGWV
jgi:hypothetical protein